METDKGTTYRQRLLAERVRDELRAARVAFKEVIETTSSETLYVFEITSPQGVALQIAVMVLDDVFEFNANGARVRIVGEDDSQWIDECARVLGLLLSSQLRIRLRRTLFGKRDGAIWVPAAEGQGSWHGDLSAIRGDGEEFVFPKWFELSPPRTL